MKCQVCKKEVTVSFEGSQTITIYAENKTQARDAIIDMVNFYDCDNTKTSVDHIKETKKG